jgi:hypothetical protein
MKYKGRVLTPNAISSNTTLATGLWSLQEQMQGVQSGNWPGIVAAATDPYFSSVQLLLHGDGNFTDSAKGTTITTFNSATTSSSIYKFGTGSLNYTASTAYATLPNSNFNFGTGDWTIEMWWYHPASIPQYGVIFDIDSQSHFFIGFKSDTTGFRIYHNPGGIDYNPTHSMVSGNWYHLAWVRSGNTITIYQGGTSIGSVSCTGVDFSPIGGYTTAFLNTYGLSGGPWYQAGSYVDEFRITKGVARYTGNFTPPTAAFPNA